MCDNLENPTENFKLSLLCLFSMLSIDSSRNIEDGERLPLDKVRSGNNNNSWVWYYDLSMVLCLGGCYTQGDNKASSRWEDLLPHQESKWCPFQGKSPLKAMLHLKVYQAILEE